MLTCHLFNGVNPEVALVIAGIHGSELSGIEVANWMRVKLQNSDELPQYTTIIVPEIYPGQARLARQYRRQNNFTKIHNGTGRQVLLGKMVVEPNRQFPKPGTPASSYRKQTSPSGQATGGVTPGGQPVLPGTYELLRLIEQLDPVRIASIHAHRAMPAAKKGTDAPGIFVDPRYRFSDDCVSEYTYKKGQMLKGPFNTNKCKFDLQKDPAFPKAKGKKEMVSALTEEGQKDDLVAFDIAKTIASEQRELVPGNHMLDKPEVVHYSASESPEYAGFSLGDWAPVGVDERGGPGDRKGCPVITVEVLEQYESWAFVKGEQLYGEDGKLLKGKSPPQLPGKMKGQPWPFDKKRSAALQVYADGLITSFLMK